MSADHDCVEPRRDLYPRRAPLHSAGIDHICTDETRCYPDSVDLYKRVQDQLEGWEEAEKREAWGR
jgi:hypothetical protein